MKVTKEQATLNREKLVDAAARLYRERGLLGIGLADLCKSVGLTHGGFYKQFPGGKEELAALAIERAFKDTAAYWANASDLHTVIDAYISTRHCDARDGCPIPYLAADAARSDGDVAHAFTRGVNQLLDFLATLSDAENPSERSAEAAQALAMAVGAVLIARAMPQGKDAAAFIQQVKQPLTGEDER
jgi:TetR/AcrR family transcriptional repressor of nem operon